MTDSIEHDAARDHLYRDVPLRHRTTIPVLGFRVHFVSSAPAVPEIAEAAFGGWRVLERTPELIEPGSSDVTVKVVAHPGHEGPDEHAPLYYRVLDRQRFLFASPGSVGYVDPGRREAVAFVTAELLADRQHFRHAVLEAMTLGTLTPHDRQPLHAAAVVRDGAAVILAGPSTVGKSTLAYAAARAGLRVLAEDTVHLQARPQLRVWGLPGYIHLPVDARERFPELRDMEPALVAAGREKLVIDLRDLDALPERPVADRAVLCLLGRPDVETGAPPAATDGSEDPLASADSSGDAPPSAAASGLRPRSSHDSGSRPNSPAATLRPVRPDAAVDEIMAGLEKGFDLFADTLRTPLEQLAGHGVWRLDLPDDPAAAIPLIEELLEGIRQNA